MKKSIFAVLIIIALGAVGSFAQTKKRAATRTKKRVPAAVKKPLVNQSAVTTASGLTYVITRRGDGAAVKAGDTVEVNYTGLLTNGVRFDSSLENGETFSFTVGAGRVIKGWDEGLQNLRVGDHAILIIPPELAYGSRGAGRVGGDSRGETTLIPPDSTLVFLIEVVSVK